MVFKRLFLGIAVIGTALTVLAAGVQESIFAFAADSTMHAASLGISVVRIADGVEVAGYNSRTAHIPASTMKSLTSATALAMLGADYSFDTRVSLVGKQKNGRLKGAIHIQGGCDPTLASKHIDGQPDFIAEIVSALKERGIKKVQGTIAFTPDEYEVMSIVPTWMMEDIAYDFGAGTYPFNYHDNCFDLSIKIADGEILNAVASPADVDFDIVNHCVLADEAAPHAIKTPEIMRFPEDRYFHLYGNILPGSRTLSYSCSMPSPQGYFTKHLEQALDAAHIEYDHDEEEAMENTSDTVQLLVHHSPQLSAVVKSLLERSDNMYTQAVLMAIGKKACGTFNASQGIKAVYRFWKDAGLDVSALWMKDGSGLSRNNKVSAEFLSTMLARAQGGAVGDIDFASLFPRLGVEGTVKRFLKGTPYEGKVCMKSGSMGEVQCYTGYFPAQNPRYAITFLVNNWSCSRAELHARLTRLLLNILPNLENN